MAHKLNKEQQALPEQVERQKVREQRKEFEAELADNFARRPRTPLSRQRRITFTVIGLIALLVGIFGFFVLLPAPAQVPTAGVSVGNPAPAFVLPIYGGGDGHGGMSKGNGSTSIDLRALRGQPVVLNFWSESCTPCRAEMPYLQRTYAKYGTQGAFTLLGVNQSDPNIDIAPFGANYNITYPLLFDKDEAVNRTYNVTSIPTTYFIDRQGVVRAVYVTQLSSETMQKGLAAIGVHIQN